MLRTHRLLLRDFVDSDAQSLFSLYGNEDFHVAWGGRYYSVPYTLVSKTTNLKVTHAAVEIYHADRRVALHPKVIAPGGCSTLPEHRPHNHRAFAESQPAEVLAWVERMGGGIHAFVLADTERRMLAHALKVLSMRRIEATVDPSNLASIRVLERLGFRFEGTFRERILTSRGPVDSNVFALLAREWNPSLASDRLPSQHQGASRQTAL